MVLADALTRHHAVAYYRSASTLQKVLFVSGTVLFLSMVIHLVALVAVGGPLDGPVSQACNLFRDGLAAVLVGSMAFTAGKAA